MTLVFEGKTFHNLIDTILNETKFFELFNQTIDNNKFSFE